MTLTRRNRICKGQIFRFERMEPRTMMAGHTWFDPQLALANQSNVLDTQTTAAHQSSYTANLSAFSSFSPQNWMNVQNGQSFQNSSPPFWSGGGSGNFPGVQIEFGGFQLTAGLGKWGVTANTHSGTSVSENFGPVSVGSNGSLGSNINSLPIGYVPTLTSVSTDFNGVTACYGPGLTTPFMTLALQVCGTARSPASSHPLSHLSVTPIQHPNAGFSLGSALNPNWQYVAKSTHEPVHAEPLSLLEYLQQKNGSLPIPQSHSQNSGSYHTVTVGYNENATPQPAYRLQPAAVDNVFAHPHSCLSVTPVPHPSAGFSLGSALNRPWY